MISHNNVLIVTATHVESQAVIEAFAKLTRHSAQPMSAGGRVYHFLGEVHGTNMYLVQTEMGSVGLGASQQTIQKGIATLKPAAVISMGIAFGVDEQKQAIGDVLVSEQILLYDLQRVGEVKTIVRGDKAHTSPWLLSIFKSAQLYWNDPAIIIRFGLILSGDKLVDQINYREQLRQFAPEAIGGEMEGAGLYVACHDAKVDWILVKAICDWADGDKAKDKDARQRLAAFNAAAFVAHALQHVAVIPQESIIDVLSEPPLSQPTDTAKDREELFKEQVIQTQSEASESPTSIVIECLFNSFNHETIRNFCQTYFPDLYKELRESDAFKKVIRLLISHCDEQRSTDKLWLCIQRENTNQHKHYYAQWEKAISARWEKKISA